MNKKEKKEKDVRYMLRLPLPLKLEMEKLAAKGLRSLKAEINMAMIEYVKAHANE